MALIQLDPARTCLLVMDMQQPFLAQCPDSEGLIANINAHVSPARSAGVMIAFVRVAFRPRYPELADTSRLASIVKPAGMLIDGGPDTAIAPGLDRTEADLIITKHRTSAFSSNDLEMILRTQQFDTLMLTGFSTGGVVLSTVDIAFDLDYRIVVPADCCSDPDLEVHEILLRKLLPRKATITTTADINWN
jgi:nicotinamidase-related amidase